MTSGTEVVKGMVKLAGNVTEECALVEMLDTVAGVRLEAEDAWRVLAKPAAHRPPVEPGANDGGCDPGRGLFEQSTSESTRVSNRLVGGCVGIPLSKPGPEADTHSVLS